MSIAYDPGARTLSLLTRRSAYQMGLNRRGQLLHLYYGPRSEGAFDYLYLPRDCGFSPNLHEDGNDRGWSPDTLPQEYSGAGAGDYRLSSLVLRAADGAWGADLRYVGHRIVPGKLSPAGLPGALDRDGDCQTLCITLADAHSGVQAELRYAVFESADVIARSVLLRNTGPEAVWLERAASLCLDLPFGAWDLISFHGRHTMERQPERAPLRHGIQAVSSARGVSSHQMNPFVILCERETGEDAGACIGLMPLYSGGHRTEVELDQSGSVRCVSGIDDGQFRWLLEPGAEFETPEILLRFSDCGLGGLSRGLHRFLRQNVCRSPYREAPRPVLLNNWEATYFDFDAARILKIAASAKDLGAELFVLDDGWFGHRDDDFSSLGDWTPHPRKLPEGLDPLIRGVHALGLKFGLWVEPEMVSEDSALYRAHPDWALTVPGRPPVLGRSQLVLDLSRPEVADWLYRTMAGLLRAHEIDYIKWDMNRNLADVYSAALPPERQGEVPHRYLLGLYSVLERLTAEFPKVLMEGCAGGGGRFDAGMLAYFPQIWCSDNTDAIARLEIQRGTSYGYPVSAVGSHVSASPNHQTGRSAPLETRSLAAMAGTYGCELDPAALTPEERTFIRGEIARYRRHSALIQTGDYYRLADDGRFTAWAIAAPDGSEALVSLVVTAVSGNPAPLHLRLKGLRPEARYRVQTVLRRSSVPPVEEDVNGTRDPERRFWGSQLLWGGLTLSPLQGDYPCIQLYLTQTD